MKSIVAKLAAPILLIMSPQAHAATLYFSLTGGATANWQIDSNPIPDFSSAVTFAVDNVPGTYAGVAGTRSIRFYTSDIGGGLLLLVDPITNFTANLFGAQLFSGPTTNPTFKLGTFALTSGPTNQFSLSISETAAVVPEPATWATMMIGFGLVGGVARYRRRSVRARLASFR